MIKKVCKWIVFKWVYPCCYYLGLWKKVDRKKVIFVENHQDNLSDNFKLLYDRLQQQGYDIHVHYLRVSSSGWKDIIFRTISLIRDMVTAGTVFISESNSVFGAFTIREDTKLVQLWHACGAFKKWGYSVADKSFGDDAKTLDMYSGHRNYDLVPVSGEAVCWAYEEAFGIANNLAVVKPLGVSRTDVYFDTDARKQAFRKITQSDISVNGRKIILYAPTFRGDIKGAKAPDALNLSRFYQELHEEYILLVKQHPFVREAMDIPVEYADFCYDVTERFTIDQLIMTADICITDYSSIVFEYSLMQKPILFFAYDLEDYYDERGFYYPYESFVPGPIVRTTEELIDCIRQIDRFDIKKLETFRNQYMSGCDGHSTERIIENVFKGTC